MIITFGPIRRSASILALSTVSTVLTRAGVNMRWSVFSFLQNMAIHVGSVRAFLFSLDHHHNCKLKMKPYVGMTLDFMWQNNFTINDHRVSGKIYLEDFVELTKKNVIKKLKWQKFKNYAIYIWINTPLFLWKTLGLSPKGRMLERPKIHEFTIALNSQISRKAESQKNKRDVFF